MTLALRNVLRNRRRSFITALAVTVGVLVVVTAKGLLNGLQTNVVESITETSTGQLQIHHSRYWEAGDSRPLKYSLNFGQISSLMQRQPFIKAYTGRVVFGGMLSTGDVTVNTIFAGIDPVRETKVCAEANKVVRGDGLRLGPKEQAEVLISEKTAGELNVTVGSMLTIITNTREGAMNAIDVVVRGVIKSAPQPQAAKMVYIPLKTAQSLLRMNGQVTEVAFDTVGKSGTKELRKTAQTMERLLDGNGLDTTISVWNEVAPFLNDSLSMMNKVLAMVTFILFVIVVMGVVNTMLMTVFERTKEIGTMMAMGFKRRKIIAMFLFESTFIGTSGACIGLIFATIILWVLGSSGVNLSLGSVRNLPIDPHVPLKFIALTMFVAVAGAILAAIYPAHKASQLNPAEALRH